MLKFLIALILVLPAFSHTVDACTLEGKVLSAYQGWFITKNDGNNVGWKHWSRDNCQDSLNAGTVNFDIMPDFSEYPQCALEDSDLRYPNGQPVKLYSATKPEIIDLHFKWMKQYKLDGVLFQRNLAELGYDNRFFEIKNKVLQNIRQSAEKYGRVFAIQWDIAATPNDDFFINKIKNDWEQLKNNLRITDSPQYLKHDGKPVVALWGPGFNFIQVSAQATIQVIQYFQDQGCYVIGGVPFKWQSGNEDSRGDFAEAYAKYDALSPWTVGAYGDKGSFKAKFDQFMVSDKQNTHDRGQLYGPVLFPGASNSNLNQGRTQINSIPRRCGTFFWEQARRHLKKLDRCGTFYVLAKFDEVDDGTAFFKVASRQSKLPVGARFANDVNCPEGTNSSDRYLYLAGQFTTLFKNSGAAVPKDPPQSRRPVVTKPSCC